MKRALVLLAYLLLATVALADDHLSIDDVGLHGYASSALAPVRLTVANPAAQPQTLQLRILWTNEYGAANRVTAAVNLAAGERRVVELPMFPVYGGTKGTQLEATAATRDGAVIARDLQPETITTANVVALMCADEDTCKTVQSQIEFSGSIENRADKNRELKFLVLREAREEWFSYTPATVIVLARPLSALTHPQRLALELFLRCGGHLVLIEDQLHDPEFLAPYRLGPSPSGAQFVGAGHLYRVASLRANTLGDIFAGGNLNSIRIRNTGYDFRSHTVRQPLLPSFTFPRLRWLLVWLAVYIIVVGLVNFALLRRFRRLEWGWLTVCAIALIFAGAFYLSGASRRPKTFRLDALALYAMDSRSPLAFAEYDLRVSAPARRDLVFSFAGPAIFTQPPGSTTPAESGQIWAEMNERRPSYLGGDSEVRLGPPLQVDLALLKWSYKDLLMSGARQFPGTVHFTAPNRLRNDTGQHFRRAVYIDSDGDRFYHIPALAPGAEVDLTQCPSLPWRAYLAAGLKWPPAESAPEQLEFDRLALQFASAARVFIGLSDTPVLPTDLNVAHQRSTQSVFQIGVEP